jgi:hypothetical protein
MGRGVILVSVDSFAGQWPPHMVSAMLRRSTPPTPPLVLLYYVQYYNLVGILLQDYTAYLYRSCMCAVVKSSSVALFLL